MPLPPSRTWLPDPAVRYRCRCRRTGDRRPPYSRSLPSPPYSVWNCHRAARHQHVVAAAAMQLGGCAADQRVAAGASDQRVRAGADDQIVACAAIQRAMPGRLSMITSLPAPALIRRGRNRRRSCHYRFSQTTSPLLLNRCVVALPVATSTGAAVHRQRDVLVGNFNDAFRLASVLTVLFGLVR